MIFPCERHLQMLELPLMLALILVCYPIHSLHRRQILNQIVLNLLFFLESLFSPALSLIPALLGWPSLRLEVKHIVPVKRVQWAGCGQLNHGCVYFLSLFPLLKHLFGCLIGGVQVEVVGRSDNHFFVAFGRQETLVGFEGLEELRVEVWGRLGTYIHYRVGFAS